MRDYFEFVHAEMPLLLDRWQATKAARPSSTATEQGTA